MDTSFYRGALAWEIRVQKIDFFLEEEGGSHFESTYAPVSNDATTFVFPQRHGNGHLVDDVTQCVDHALPDAREISKVENVVELCGSGQHLDLKIEQKRSKNVFKARGMFVYIPRCLFT